MDAPSPRAPRRVDDRPLDHGARHHGQRADPGRAHRDAPVLHRRRRAGDGRGPRPRPAPSTWCRWPRPPRSRTSPPRRRTAPLGADVHAARPRSDPRARRTGARRAGYRAIVASVDGAAVGRGIASASAGRLTPPDWIRYPNLASDDDADSSDIMRHGHRLRSVDHLRRPRAVRRVERLAGRGEGRAARRRRRRVRSTPVRRRSRSRTTVAACSTASPPPPTCCPRSSTRSAGGPRCTSTAASAPASTW